MMKFQHVAVGGTFDRFHKGHKALLEKTLELGRRVTIGLTSDGFSGRGVEPYENRKECLERHMHSLGAENYVITQLEDPFGPARTDGSMDALVVSEETFERGLELNRLRRLSGLNELEIISIPMVKSDDGEVISSSRIRMGEIDSEGRVK